MGQPRTRPDHGLGHRWSSRVSSPGCQLQCTRTEVHIPNLFLPRIIRTYIRTVNFFPVFLIFSACDPRSPAQPTESCHRRERINWPGIAWRYCQPRGPPTGSSYRSRIGFSVTLHSSAGSGRRDAYHSNVLREIFKFMEVQGSKSIFVYLLESVCHRVTSEATKLFTFLLRF